LRQISGESCNKQSKKHYSDSPSLSRERGYSMISGILNLVRRLSLLPNALVVAVLASLPISLRPGQVSAGPGGPLPQTAEKVPVAVVVVDPAHGGADSGARGPGGTESEVVLDFARAVRVALEGQGLRIVLTREASAAPSPDTRSTLVNGLRGAVFISLHVSSTGPAGTARAYWYSFPDAAPSPLSKTQAALAPPTAPAPRGLVQWEQAQQPFLDASHQLAQLVQIQLARKFSGSNETPAQSAVRQLRTIAAPAIAIEVSSVAVTDPQQLLQMGPGLADAVARGVADFRSQTLPAAGATP
jgi:N-acetylmuramoyl-L-alanine amidase